MLDEPATERATSQLDSAADAVSVASDFGAVWIGVAALQLLTGRTTAAEAVRRLAAAGVASLALTRVLKHVFSIPRSDTPTTGLLARTPTSSGFPSGHTLAAFLSALVIPTTARGRAVALGFASVVAWARVRVGHHRPVDVVAGAAVGSVIGAAVATALSARSKPGVVR